jgi:hypothetical protein
MDNSFKGKVLELSIMEQFTREILNKVLVTGSVFKRISMEQFTRVTG